MDPSEFQAPKAGRIVTTPEGCAAFVPASLDEKLEEPRPRRRGGQAEVGVLQDEGGPLGQGGLDHGVGVTDRGDPQPAVRSR